MILVMPDNQSLERRQTMRAFGAELVLTPKAGGMEDARDLAERMRDEGKGIILDQFANPDNPLAHYRGTGPEIWRDTQRRDHAFRVGDGHDRHDHGRVALPEGEESGDHDRRRAAGGGLADPRHPQVAGGLPAEDLRPRARRPDRARVAGGRRGDDAPARDARRASSAASRRAAPARSRCASRARSRTRRSCSSSAIAATATCRPACSRRWRAHDADPRLRHRDRARYRRAPPRATSCRRSSPTPRVLDWFTQQRRAQTGSDFAPLHLQQVVAIACALRDGDRPQDRVGRRRRTTPSPSSSAASSTSSTSTRRSSCRGTAAASTCRC